jgi:hypothetical protein
MPTYNPLDKHNLGDSVAKALLEKEVGLLPLAEPFVGAGIYAIYYLGNLDLYRPIASKNRGREPKQPIYIGKAVPAGARKGGLGFDADPGEVLFKRLKEHADSIRESRNLQLDHFRCRYLVVDDIWIPLGEALLIDMFSPLWNKVLDGFGNHDPGKGRYNQQRSPWDTIHPGRAWAEKCKSNLKSEDELLRSICLFLGA